MAMRPQITCHHICTIHSSQQHSNCYGLCALNQVFCCRLSPVEKLSRLDGGERHHAFCASPISPKIIQGLHLRSTVTPEQGIPTGLLADLEGFPCWDMIQY